MLAISLRPGVTWFDSGELVTGAFHLGISHPAGHAPWSLLVKPWLLLPFGSVAFRVSLFSLVCAVVTVVLTHRLACRLAGADRLAERWAAAALTLPLVAHQYVVLQATRQEVYALVILLHVLAAWLFVGVLEQRRTEVGLALVAAYEVVLNPLLGAPVLTLVAAATVISWRRDGFIAVGAMAFAFASPLFALLYLPLRSAAGTIMDWGSPRPGKASYR